MSNFVINIAFARPSTDICWTHIHKGLVVESSDLIDVISFTTGTDVSPLVNTQEASSMAHGINSKPPVEITWSVVCAYLPLFNLM